MRIEQNFVASRRRDPSRRTAQMSSGVALLASAVMAFGAGGAHATTSLQVLSSVASSYNLFLSGDMGSSSSPISYSDVEGRVAVGGSAYLRGYSIGANTPGGVGLTVGQNLNFNSGTIYGSVAVGGNATFANAAVNGVVSTGGALISPPSTYVGTAPYTVPSNYFTSTAASLQAASALLDSAATQAKGTVGNVSNTYGTLNLTSNATGVVFFDLAGSQLVGINGLNFNVNSGATVVVNVTGPVGGSIGNFGFQGNYQTSKTLFNFVDATLLSLSNLGYQASILAPKATIAFNNGQTNGAVMAKAWTGGAQVNEAAFTGDLLAVGGGVPEPGVWTMMLMGLFGMGATLRGVRRKTAEATSA